MCVCVLVFLCNLLCVCVFYFFSSNLLGVCGCVCSSFFFHAICCVCVCSSFFLLCVCVLVFFSCNLSCVF